MIAYKSLKSGITICTSPVVLNVEIRSCRLYFYSNVHAAMMLFMVWQIISLQEILPRVSMEHFGSDKIIENYIVQN